MRGKMERCHEGGFGRCGAVVLSLFSTSVSFPHFLQFVSGAAGAFLHSLSHPRCACLNLLLVRQPKLMMNYHR